MSSSKRARTRSSSNESNEHLGGFNLKVKPLNWAQETYLEAIESNDIIFGIGSAGTGKTYVAATYAAEKLFHRDIKKVIVTRPNIESSPTLGLLPGELEEKYAPFLEPFHDVFTRAFGKSFYELLIKKGNIEPRPLGYMRGATFDDAIVLVDECQNMTVKEFMMLLSRIGKNTKMILSGDHKQCDIRDSGLTDAVERTKHIKGVESVYFTHDDIVRSNMCKEIIIAYEH